VTNGTTEDGATTVGQSGPERTAPRRLLGGYPGGGAGTRLWPLSGGAAKFLLP
jgi:hypothetical protein